METTKRVRASKSRDARYYSACSELISRWRNVIRDHTPLQRAHADISAWIDTLDVTSTQRVSLYDRSWAMRDFAVMSGARWQLYLDGQPRTFDEISAIATIAEKASAHLGKGAADTAHNEVMHRICGRHEWHTSHDPFYADEVPGNLHSSHASR